MFRNFENAMREIGGVRVDLSVLYSLGDPGAANCGVPATGPRVAGQVRTYFMDRDVAHR